MRNIKQNKATVNLYLDKRTKLKNGTYPIKLRITHNREFKLFGIGKYSFTLQDWDAMTKANPRGTLKDYKIELNLIEAKAKNIVDAIREFSFTLFKDTWEGNTVLSNDLSFSACLTARKKMYEQQGRISTAENAQTIFNSFKIYFELCSKDKDPDLRDLSAKDYKAYAEFMLNKGKSQATIGIYTREIRAMYNSLIDEGILEKEFYPFGKGGFKPPSAKKTKTAIMKEDIRKIINYNAETLNSEAYCRDIWIFSYICNGMNIKDIALLKYQDIQNDFLFFKRAKTKRSKSTEQTISVPLLPLAKEIISRWGNTNKNLDNFIFPILVPNITAKDQRRVTQNTCSLITDYIKKIAIKLELAKTDITANSARDAFATISMHEGRPLSDISESLGHSSISVTEHYLAGFANATKMEWQKHLI